ncbi:MAG: hypothetical protein AAF513_07005, partial [Pseudomonadota bacterium]
MSEPPAWYLITTPDGLAIQLRGELVIGEDAEGGFVLDGAQPDSRWLRFSISPDGLLSASSNHADYVLFGDIVEDPEGGVKLDEGTLISMPGKHEVYISHTLMRGQVRLKLALQSLRDSDAATQGEDEADAGEVEAGETIVGETSQTAVDPVLDEPATARMDERLVNVLRGRKAPENPAEDPNEDSDSTVPEAAHDQVGADGHQEDERQEDASPQEDASQQEDSPQEGGDLDEVAADDLLLVDEEAPVDATAELEPSLDDAAVEDQLTAAAESAQVSEIELVGQLEHEQDSLSVADTEDKAEEAAATEAAAAELSRAHDAAEEPQLYELEELEELQDPPAPTEAAEAQKAAEPQEEVAAERELLTVDAQADSEASTQGGAPESADEETETQPSDQSEHATLERFESIDEQTEGSNSGEGTADNDEASVDDWLEELQAEPDPSAIALITEDRRRVNERNARVAAVIMSILIVILFIG